MADFGLAKCIIIIITKFTALSCLQSVEVMKFFQLISLLLAIATHAFIPSKSVQFQNHLRMMAAANHNFDYDLIIVGCGVGGHGAALHAKANGLKTAVFTGKDVGGTCVNRGCVPSKALLAAAGRIREMKNAHHLKSFGISVGDVKFERSGVAEHANQLANRVKVNLESSLKAQGVTIIDALGQLTNQPHQVKLANSNEIVTAKDIILAPGSVPFVPRGNL